MLIKKLSKRKDDILIKELEFAQEYLCKELEYQKKKGILRLKTNDNKSNEDVVYRRGILGAQFEFGAAVGLFNSVINFTILILANRLSKKITQFVLW